MRAGARSGPWMLASLLLATSVASAQPARGERAIEVATARDAFRSGLAHAQAGRWPEARAAFDRSYAIAPRSITLLNLAGAQAQTGALVLASETYRRFIREPGRRAARHRAAARAALSALEERIAHVEFSVRGVRPDDVVRLDSEAVAMAILDGPAALDPGPHRLEVSRGGEVVAERSFELTEGEHATIELVVTAPLPSPTLAPNAAELVLDGTEVSEGDDIVEDPLFWVVLIGVLTFAGAGLGIGLNLSQGPVASDVVGERTRL